MKTLVLVCAAMMAFTASAFGMHKAGWFSGKAPRHLETRQVRGNDPLHSDAALRYRQNQTTNWRLLMTVR
jgi:hypothetical protein